eukprot:9598241-Alexandrium_andersonii.AAC.1
MGIEVLAREFGQRLTDWGAALPVDSGGVRVPKERRSSFSKVPPKSSRQTLIWRADSLIGASNEFGVCAEVWDPSKRVWHRLVQSVRKFGTLRSECGVCATCPLYHRDLHESDCGEALPSGGRDGHCGLRPLGVVDTVSHLPHSAARTRREHLWNVIIRALQLHCQMGPGST